MWKCAQAASASLYLNFRSLQRSGTKLGKQQKLEAGTNVADVGCGKGAYTRIMAQAFPKSNFLWFDYHRTSIEAARQSSSRKGLHNITLTESAANAYAGNDSDFVAVFDSLHDMGDPVGAAKHILGSLKPDGTWRVVEPFAHDSLKDNLNPAEEIYYSSSTLQCTPCTRLQAVGLCLGGQAGEARIRDVVTRAGFTRFRRTTDTPLNIVYQAKPSSISAGPCCDLLQLVRLAA